MATNEFTKKLRAAIKTKIQELGIEVDDELPDYIMIMIANKKDKAKMKNDLMLFLSDNTDPFVDWLFDFFEKVNKKENEEAKAREPEKQAVVKKRHSSEERQKSRSRSPVLRSRSPRRTRQHEDEKPKRAPIRAPSPKRERERSSRRRDERRRRSRSPDDDRKSRRRDDRKKITYSDEEDEEPHRSMKSQVVVAKSERPPSPKLASKVVVKRPKADPVNAKAGSSLFKRALTDTLRDEDQPQTKHRRREEDVLQVNSLRTSRRTVTQNEEESDISEEEEEERETQFIVKLGKGAITRKTIRASMDEAPPGDENYAVQHAAEKVLRRKRRVDDPVLAFLKLSGSDVRRAPKGAAGGGAVGIEEAAVAATKRKRMMMAAAAASHGTSVASLAKHWNGKIEFDEDDDEEDESDNEAEIDAFLASAHDSRIPPTEALSRPLQYIVPQKKQFGTSKPPEVGKIAERCKFWPKCRNEETCSYSHPSKPCINFPNCWFGDKCMFIHPQCKFEPNCNKPTCPYTHALPRPIAPRATAALPPRQANPLPITTPATGSDSSGNASAPTNASSEPSKTASEFNNGQDSSEQQHQTTEEQQNGVKVDGNSDETIVDQQNGDVENNVSAEAVTSEEKTETGDAKVGVPDILVSKAPPPASKLSAMSIQSASTQLTATSNVMCRFAGRCHNEGCSFRHPKKCRYDEACTNESCYFWHPKKNAGRFRWVKT
uniref:Zinc finger CCCH domain-containing protein 14 n=1 Tax=Panagrolaimus sp. ES5 TaxID=591445 RepID=A0AC34FP96_9BILA